MKSFIRRQFALFSMLSAAIREHIDLSMQRAGVRTAAQQHQYLKTMQRKTATQNRGATITRLRSAEDRALERELTAVSEALQAQDALKRQPMMGGTMDEDLSVYQDRFKHDPESF